MLHFSSSCDKGGVYQNCKCHDPVTGVIVLVENSIFLFLFFSSSTLGHESDNFLNSIMITKEGSTQIAHFVTPVAGILGRGEGYYV